MNDSSAELGAWGVERSCGRLSGIKQPGAKVGFHPSPLGPADFQTPWRNATWVFFGEVQLSKQATRIRYG